MIYVVSDTHGKFRRVMEFLGSGPITKDDILIILGDAGFNYDAIPGSGLRRKAPVNSYDIPVLCLQGNHELRPEHIESYREINWNGGVVYQEERYPNLLFAKDGECYTIDGKQILVCGGAYTVFKEYRIKKGLPWYADEQPSEEIKRQVEARLDMMDWKVDVMLTHTCPSKVVPTEKYIPGVDQSTVDKSTEEWLDRIEDRLQYDAWYCGHWHIEKQVGAIHFIYQNFVVI